MLMSDAFAAEPTLPATTSSDVGIAGADAAPYELSQEKMLTDTLVFLFLLFAIFYFVLIRPQQKKFKAHQTMISSLQKGDKILTSGGMIGTIHKFEGDHIVVVELAENMRVKFARSSISDLYKEPEAAKQPTPKPTNDN